MWLAAEAEFMFQKLVIVFTTFSLKYIIIVSVICWGKIQFSKKCYCLYIPPLILSLTAVPLIPVVISVSINHEYYLPEPNISRETGEPAL